jgi:FAD dependent oxidoreductase TIGR03364
LNKYLGLKSSYCKAGLFFPEEVTVEPNVMIHRLRTFMIEQMGLYYVGNTAVVAVEEINDRVVVNASNGSQFQGSKVIICNGHDFKTLYPEIYNASDLEVAKLQMLQTKPQANYRLDGSILTGWTIRRYESFIECPSYSSIKAKEDKESFQRQYGVHILFKQAVDGSVIIGDSHEYADAKNVDQLGYDLNMDIDNFMIAEAKKIIDLPTYDIQNRWAGFYSQCKTKDLFQEKIGNNIHIVTGIGGKGMTGSAGFSKMNLNQIMNN